MATGADSLAQGGTMLLAAVGYLVAMLMAGLLAAIQRLSGLHRNRLCFGQWI